MAEPGGERWVSIADVAALAGVSPTTVSHALSGKRHVSAATIERVTAAMESLGYVPNVAARNLKKGSTEVLGLLVPDIANPYFADLAKGVEDEALVNGYSVLIGNTDFDPARERHYLQMIGGRAIDGLIYASGSPPDASRLDNWARDFPVVFADEEIPAIEAAMVIGDNRAGGRLVGELLRGLGHREALVISGPPGLPSSEYRVAGFREAFGGSIELTNGGFTLTGGTTAALDVLRSLDVPPTCIFATSDVMAIGVLIALRQLGRSVPSDVSVVGYDDILIASLVQPALTTVRQPGYEIGRAAARQLLGRLVHGGAVVPQRQVVAATLVVRESTARPRQAARS